MPDMTRFSLDQEALASGMQRIFQLLEYNVRAELAEQGIELSRPAKLARRPSPTLESAYRSLLDPLRPHERIDEAAAGDFHTDDFAISLICASLHRNVFVGEAVQPLIFAKRHEGLRAAMGDMWRHVDDYLRLSRMDMDTACRHAYRRSLAFEAGESSVEQAINMVTWSMIELVQEHLHGSVGASAVSDGIVTGRWWKSFDGPVREAILLRREVSCARENYVFRWPQRWGAFEAGYMQTRDRTHGTAVKATFFPALVVERVGGWETVSKSTVRVI